MGYRSDVMAVIYPDVKAKEEDQALYDQLKVLMATTFKDTINGAKTVDGFESCMDWLDDDRVLKFDIPGVKWYDTYPDVQAFHAMMTQFGCDVIPGYCTEFIRIGEDDDDVHVERSGQNIRYYLGVHRAISCDL